MHFIPAALRGPLFMVVATGSYVVDRYLMSAADMAKARELRGQIELKACTADEEALALLADRQDIIRSSLPDTPNERLVYQCSPVE